MYLKTQVPASLLYVGLLHFAPVVSLYDAANPPSQENLDPAEANPVMSVTCVGGSSDLSPKLKVRNGYRSLSMQEVCAKPQYGGRDRRPNLAAYCGNGDVTFDAPEQEQWGGRGDLSTPQQDHLLAQLECRNRCYCGHMTAQQPKIVPATRNNFDVAPVKDPWWKPSVFSLDVEDSDTLSLHQKPNPRTNIFIGHQVDVQRELALGLIPDFINVEVAMLQENHISCIGNLPSFALPSPWSVNDFHDNQELCAVQFSKGNP
jgi:hypothetical protein